MEKLHWKDHRSPVTIYGGPKVKQYKDYIKEAAKKGNKEAQWYMKHGLKPC